MRKFLFAFLIAFLVIPGFVPFASWEFAKSPSHEYLRTDDAETPPQWNDGDFSVSLWFRADNVTESHALLRLEHDYDGEKSNRYTLVAAGHVDGDPIRWMAQVSDTQYFVETTAGFTAGTWHHVLAYVIKDAPGDGSLLVYLDGGNNGWNGSAYTPTTDEDYIQVSGDNVFIQSINGEIAEVAIWNLGHYALGEDNIAALAKGYSPLHIKPQNLIWYSPLVRGLQEYMDAFEGTAYNNPEPANDHPPILK